jgi:hypothetical protein
MWNTAVKLNNPVSAETKVAVNSVVGAIDSEGISPKPPTIGVAATGRSTRPPQFASVLLIGLSLVANCPCTSSVGYFGYFRSAFQG